MILNQSQAKAVFDALCALNSVGFKEFDVVLDEGPGQPDAPRVLIKPDGKVRIWLHDADRTYRPETYDDQAAFIAAYNLN